MNQQVREAEGVTPDHPVPVPVDSFPLDLDERRRGDKQPDQIERVESHAADFSAGGVRRHISGGQNNQQYGHEVDVAVETMEPAAFFKYSIGKVDQARRHGQTCKSNMNVHDIQPDRKIQLPLQPGFTA